MFNSIKAVVAGVLTDLGGTFAFGIMATLVVGAISGLEAGSAAVVRAAVYRTMSTDAYIVASLIGAAFFTVCGGFRAARIADKLELVHAGVVGLVATVVSAPVLPGGAAASVSIVAVMLAMPAALAGGALGARPPRHGYGGRRQLGRLSALR